MVIRTKGPFPPRNGPTTGSTEPPKGLFTGLKDGGIGGQGAGWLVVPGRDNANDPIVVPILHCDFRNVLVGIEPFLGGGGKRHALRKWRGEEGLGEFGLFKSDAAGGEGWGWGRGWAETGSDAIQVDVVGGVVVIVVAVVVLAVVLVVDLALGNKDTIIFRMGNAIIIIVIIITIAIAIHLQLPQHGVHCRLVPLKVQEILAALEVDFAILDEGWAIAILNEDISEWMEIN